MKKFLLPLTLAVLCGGAMQAQETAVIGEDNYGENTSPCNMAKENMYSATQAVYYSTALEKQITLEEYNITALTYYKSKYSGSGAPSDGKGHLTIYAAVSPTELTAPISTTQMTKVYDADYSTADWNNGLKLNLDQEITMKKGDNLVIGFVMYTTETNASVGWASDESEYNKLGAIGTCWLWEPSTSPIDFTGSYTLVNSTYKDIPQIGITYTEVATEPANAFMMTWDAVSAERISETEGEVTVQYTVTEEQNVAGLHFFVESGENTIGEYDIKAGAKGEVVIPVTLDTADAYDTYVKCYAVYEGEEQETSATFEYGDVVTVPAYETEAERAFYLVSWQFDETGWTPNHMLPSFDTAIQFVPVEGQENVYTLTFTLSGNDEWYQIANEKGEYIFGYNDSPMMLSDRSYNLAYKGDDIKFNTAWAGQEIELTFTYAEGSEQENMAYPVSTLYVKVKENPNTAVELVGADNENAMYFNLQGVRVANPENGMYIRVANGKAQKVMVK